MNELVIEATLGGLSLALRKANGQGNGPIMGRHTTAPRSSSVLHPMLAELLAEAGLNPADIQTLGVAVGPGSFTGARVAVAVAEAWGLVHTGAQPQCKLVGLSSLGLVAHAVVQHNPEKLNFRVLADAAGGMVYGQDFTQAAQPLSPAWCLPLAAAVATELPLAAANLPLIEAHWHLPTLPPEALMAGLNDPACHLPLAALYLKPLNYHAKT